MNKPSVGSFINLPSGYFGMVLGIIGMGFAWRYAATIWPVSPLVGSDDGLVHFIAVPLFIFTNVIIGLLLARTFILLMQGKLIVRTALPKKRTCYDREI